MKNVLVILAHPDGESFNATIAHRCGETLSKNGYEVLFHDLVREGFDPLLPTAEIPAAGPVDPAVDVHCRELVSASGLIVVHPNWWGMPPAVLTGWVDRVIRPGVAYRFLEGDSGEGVPLGLLAGKTALVFNTANTPPEREETDFGDPLDSIWRRCVFGLCGVTTYFRRTFSVVVTSTREEREGWLDEAAETVNRYFPKE
ncbi:MAG: NAD(P)H-dependent oxidoreductase [Deltaproteobacteria bacterium]|nr:NAD(P)H-dependent oxidoreductase [Candidatus Zymogenaceae bacterium]